MTNRARLLLAAILLVALVLRLGWALGEGRDRQPRSELGGDAYAYEVAGASIADGDGYTALDGSPTAYHVPGYPYLVGATYALSGNATLAPKLLNVLLGTLTVLLTFMLGRRLFGEATGLAAAAVIALWPGVIFYTALPMPEPAATFLLVSLLLAGQSLLDEGTRSRMLCAAGLAWATAGVLLGAAVLVRSELVLVPAALLPALIRRPPRASAIAVFAAAFVLTLTPWVVRNGIRMRSLTLSTGFGDNLYVGHNPSTDGGGQLHDALYARYASLDGPAREVAYNRAATRAALSYIRHHPIDDLRLVRGKLSHLWVGDDPALYIARGLDLRRTERDRILSFVANFYWYAVLAGVALSVPAWRTFNRRQWGLPIVILGWCVLFGLVTHGEQRYHTSLSPVLAILAAHAVITMVMPLSRKAWTARPRRLSHGAG